MSYSDDILRGIKKRLLISYPFFGSALSDLALVPSTRTGRIYATGREILYSRKFVESASPGEIAYWLCREILHLTMGHGDRRRMRSPSLWAVSTEYCVSSILSGEGLAMGVQLRFFRRGFNGKSAEEIYATLLREFSNPHMMQEMGALDSLFPEFCDLEEETPDISQDLASLSSHLQVDTATLSEILKESASRSAEYGNYRAKTLELVAKARISERTMGKKGFAVDLPVEAGERQNAPWQELLVSYSMNDRTGHSYRRFSRRYVADDIYLPQRYNLKRKLVLAVDVSASVPEETLNAFFSDILYLMRSRDMDSDIRLVQVDAEIQSDMMIDRDMEQDVFLRRRGFGGTDFRPLFRKLDSEGNQDPVIIFTDGRGDAPDIQPEGYEVIWITTDLNMPWGRNIQYGELE